MENTIGTIIAAVIGGTFAWLVARNNQPSDSKREIELINDQSLYWKTYYEAFPDDPAVQERAKRALVSLSDRLERVSESSDPQTVVDLVSVSTPVTVPFWRFVLFLYGPASDILGIYVYGLFAGGLILSLAIKAYHLIGGALWLWIFNSAAIGFLLARGVAAISEFQRIRHAIRKGKLPGARQTGIPTVGSAGDE